MASLGLNIEEQQAVNQFKQSVIEPSMSHLVVLDFYADWCGPCKALAPTLEKVATDYAEKGVALVKINVDENQFIAAQFQVRTIPTVYAIYQGQPIADLTNARSESQLKNMLDGILAKIQVQPVTVMDAAPDVSDFLAMGDGALADNDPTRAKSIYGQVIEMTPDNAAAHAGLISAHIALNETEEARAHLQQCAGMGLADAPQILHVAKALSLADQRIDDGALTALRRSVADDPGNMESGMAFATAAFAAGLRDEAADCLLNMIERDRNWNEGAARAKLLEFFEVIGLEDEWVVHTRKRLSRVLFG